MIDSRLLSVLTVYETGSFTRAAERLSLSQPAVSQHVRQLENELHVHIFERVRGTLRVTREGEIIVRICIVLSLSGNAVFAWISQ